MKPKADHLTWRATLDLLDGRESPDSWTEHLGSCTSCSRQMEEGRVLSHGFEFAAETRVRDSLVEQVLGRIDHYGPELAAEVEWAREEADRLSQAGAAPSGDSMPGSVSMISRLRSAAGSFLAAALVMDSWRDQAVAVRGSSTASPRILVYESQDHTVSISLHIGPDPEEFELDLVGQMAPKKGTSLPEGIIAYVETAQGDEFEAKVQPFGEFRFEALRSRPVGLVIDLGSERIEMRPFPELGAS